MFSLTHGILKSEFQVKGSDSMLARVHAEKLGVFFVVEAKRNSTVLE